MSDDVSARVTSEPTGRRDVHWCLIVWREVPGLAPHAQAHMRVDFRARRVEVASADVKAVRFWREVDGIAGPVLVAPGRPTPRAS